MEEIPVCPSVFLARVGQMLTHTKQLMLNQDSRPSGPVLSTRTGSSSSRGLRQRSSAWLTARCFQLGKPGIEPGKACMPTRCVSQSHRPPQTCLYPPGCPMGLPSGEAPSLPMSQSRDKAAPTPLVAWRLPSKQLLTLIKQPAGMTSTSTGGGWG